MSEDMPSNVNDEVFLTDDDILSFTQKKRKELVDTLVDNGMPVDPKDRTTLLHALSDMDQTAMNNKKLGAQQKIADADRIAIMAIQKMSSQLGGRNPFESDGETINATPVIDEKKLPEPDPVEGETDIGLSTTNYDDFMKKFED